MKNKFEMFISKEFIFKLLVSCDLIDIEKTTKDKALEKFLKLDERYKFYRIFSALYLSGSENFKDAIKYLNNELDKSFKEGKKYDINLVAPILRSFLVKNVNKANELENKVNEIIEESDLRRKLNPFNFNDFLNIDDKKIYYVNRMFAASTINMVFAPPKNMKSFISYYLALCISQGKDFFKQKTKKVSVGYFDWENPISDVQNRIRGICKGMDFDTTNINNFYFFPKQHTLLRVEKFDTMVYMDLKEQLIDFIKEKEIKVLFFDTLRRLGNFEENDSRTINTIKSDLFDPLINETGVCIIFLHHTSKEGSNYRGSVDIEGIVDTSFKIRKIQRNDSLEIIIDCAARRNNEIDKITSSVVITNNSYEDENGDMIEDIEEVIFEKKQNKDDQEDNYSEYRKIIIDNLLIDEEYKNKELVEILKDKTNITSIRTLNKIIAWLTKVNVLMKTGENKNTRYYLNPNLKYSEEVKTYYKGEDITKENIENSLHRMFKDNDALLKEKIINDKKQHLNGLFNIEYIAPILDDWNKKGWLNLTRDGEIRVTELYREENQK